MIYAFTVKGSMIQAKKIITLILICLLFISLAACGGDSNPDSPESISQSKQDDGKKKYRDLVVGYSQIGAESEWRTGNSNSMKLINIVQKKENKK